MEVIVRDQKIKALETQVYDLEKKCLRYEKQIKQNGFILKWYASFQWSFARRRILSFNVRSFGQNDHDF